MKIMRQDKAPAGSLAGAVGMLAAALLSAAAQGQTTAAIRGTVFEPDGDPASATPVIITDTRTGDRRTVSTNEAGTFTARGLNVGGPYTIRVDSPVFADRAIEGVHLTLGDTYNFEVTLGAGTIESITVTASALSRAEVAMGPSSTFSLQDLQTAPSVNRDIKDLLRIDPRIYVDEAFVDAVQCTGANPRFNSLTVDGVRLNDNFGLNSNGYPTERMPFPYDAIEQISVELAPFDVQYGGFSACNINAVTKSGANEFYGSLFYDYTSDSWRGDSLEGDDIELGNFDEDRYGGFIGGPIIQDRLFFFLAYEEMSGAAIFDRGPAGSGRAREVQGVSREQYERIRQGALELYDYDPGGLPASLPIEDKKYLAKLDWNIADGHRATLSYNYNDGFNIAESDDDNNELEFSNHYYERGAELTSYVGQLFSDWTANFSTELRIGYTELDNRQLSLAGTDFGEMQITTLNDHDGDGVNSRATVYLGSDDSRHANKLKYDNELFKLAGTYVLGDHVFYGGYEREQFDMFNMFVQEAEGEYRFDSVEDFLAGRPSRVIYENAAPSNIPEDAAAEFSYEIHSVYLQDEFVLPRADVTIVAGLRYDWYESGDLPRHNPNFADRYGYSNQQNFDGLDLLQPRLGVEWNITDSLSLHGGAGLYSGGNPNVWLSNNYSNDGLTQVERSLFGLDEGGDTLFTIPFTGAGRPGYDIPQALYDEVAGGTADSSVNALDPDFDLPSSWKYALGATYRFDLPGGWGSDYLLTADFLYTDMRDSAIVRDLTLEPVGSAPDGRPIYAGIDRADLDCVDPLSGDCDARSEDFLLTNVQGSDGFQRSLALGLSKTHDFGLSWALGYAYTEAEDVNPMTSSVAFSNFSNVAVADPNNPGPATSNYEVPHRFTLRLQYERAFWDDNMTRVTLFGSRNEGRPYTYTFTNGFMFGDSVGFVGRPLLYVPSGANDPNVEFAPGFNTEAFFNFVAENGLGSGILERNAFHSDWWTKFDLRVEQEIPGFFSGNKLSAFFIIENLGNLLNDDWGVMYEAGFPRYQSIVDATIDPASGRYVFNEFFEPDSQGRVTDASLWEARLGLRYDF